MALAGKGADIYLASGAPNAVVTQAMTSLSVAQGAANGAVIVANQWYRPTLTARRFADPAVAPNVYYNGILQAASLYTWEPAGGIVKFLASPGALAVTTDYSYLTVAQVGGAHEWTLGLEQDLADVTTFGSSWKSKLPVGEINGSISLSRWWLDNRFLAWLTSTTDATFTNVNPSPRLFLSLYTDFTNNLHYDTLATMKSDAVKAAIAGVVEEELTLESEGTITYANW